MARTLHKLNDAYVRSTKLKPGRHSDGGSLFLSVAPGGSKSWVFVWTRAGRKREMGLGSYPVVGLAKARERAAASREAVADGRDPIAERDKGTEPTFGECADMFLASMKGQWKNTKHRYQWEQTLGDAYCRELRAKRISDIDTGDVLKVLEPIWQSKHETATRLRGRIERVLDYARVRGWRFGENPALWRGHLRGVLPTIPKRTRVVHLAAMPYADVPAFVQGLQQREALTARCLAFQILTAVRPGEARGASWGEIDMEAAVWTIPGERMKAGETHRVPLSEAAMAILRPLLAVRTGDLVFPGFRKGRPLSDVAVAKLMSRAGADAFTAHGFRSSFRDWAGDSTSFPREIAEGALAHTVGSEVELAYRRSDAIAKRRKLMDAWSQYCTTPKTDTVVQFRRSK